MSIEFTAKLTCPHCSHETEKIITRERPKGDFICISCGQLVEFDGSVQVGQAENLIPQLIAPLVGQIDKFNKG